MRSTQLLRSKVATIIYRVATPWKNLENLESGDATWKTWKKGIFLKIAGKLKSMEKPGKYSLQIG
jgi:hypothetical protein